MMGLRVCFWVALGISAWVLAGPAKAQDSLDAGKTPAQLFASDCAVCHKSPLGLSKAGGIFGLSSFLRQHYTTSRASASAIADYIEQLDRAAAAEPRKTPPKRAVRRDQSRKPAPAKKSSTSSNG
jgi:mono/diheme cytochrome c family protein